MAAKKLNEEQVKKILNIDDFRHLTKDKVIEFASMIDKMDPEVAKKVLEQVPEFALTARETVKCLSTMIEKGLKSSEKSVQYFYLMSSNTIDTLRGLLEKDNITPEDREYIIEEINYILNEVSKKDSEHKKHVERLVGCGIGVACFVFGGVGAALGINYHINNK